MSAPIRLGILRLADSAPAVVAEARGLFRDAGVDVTLAVEPSWANIADKLAWGALDAAILLAPLALAAQAGLRGRATRLRVPMGISRGGNSIVVGSAVPSLGPDAPAAFIAWLARQDAPPRFAVVHVFSMHNLLLRHWLAGAGLDPDRALDIVVVPPDRIVGELAAGRIAGFCAGAPWGEHARALGAGRVILETAAIRPDHLEKCLVVTERLSTTNPAAVASLARALARAQELCEADGAEAASLTAARLDLPEQATRASLPGGTATARVSFAQAGEIRAEDVAWMMRALRRWGWVPTTIPEHVATEAFGEQPLFEA